VKKTLFILKCKKLNFLDVFDEKTYFIFSSRRKYRKCVVSHKYKKHRLAIKT